MWLSRQMGLPDEYINCGPLIRVVYPCMIMLINNLCGCLARVVKEAGVSVSDSAAVWFLQVLASTVTAAIPMAPVLQRNILLHSR